MTQPSDVVAATPPADGPVTTGNGLSATLRDRGWSAFHPSSTTVDAGFFTWELESGEVMCDAVTYRMHGLPEDPSATMDTFLTRVPESDLPQLLEAIQQMVASSGTYQLEYRVKSADGSLRTMETRGRVLPGPDGRPARMMGMVVDITASRCRSGTPASRSGPACSVSVRRTSSTRRRRRSSSRPPRCLPCPWSGRACTSSRARSRPNFSEASCRA